MAFCTAIKEKGLIKLKDKTGKFTFDSMKGQYGNHTMRSINTGCGYGKILENLILKIKV